MFKRRSRILAAALLLALTFSAAAEIVPPPPKPERQEIPAPEPQRDERIMLEKEATAAEMGEHAAGAMIFVLIAISAAFTLFIVLPNKKRLKAEGVAAPQTDGPPRRDGK